MELKILEIHNIASIEDALIDFSSAPLKDEPLFLICGETGAGKSTILDAICLALYNKTPRFFSSEPEKIEDRVFGELQDRDREAQVIRTDDPRQFLRRGTGEGHVKLVFTGADEVEYTALWSVFRSRGKSSGKLRPVEWTLSWEDVTLSLQKDVRQRVEQVTGLNFNQFCRTTMLAQGEFSRFLKSTEAEKADILEKLTRTDLYSRMGARIYAAAKEKREAYNIQKARTEGIVLLSREERSEIERTVETKNAELQSVREKYMKYRGQLDRFLKKDGIENRLKAFSVSRQEKYGEYVSLMASTALFRDGLEALGREEAALKAKLESEAVSERMYASCQAILQDLQGVMDARKEMQESISAAEKLRNEIGTRKPEIEVMKQSLAAMIGEKAEIQQKIDNIRSEAGMQDRQGLAQERTMAEKRRNDLLEAAYAVKSMMDTAGILENARAKLQESREEAGKSRAELADAEKRYSDAMQAYADAGRIYDSMKDSVESWAKVARSRLHDGDMCPLCGSRIGKLVSDAEFERMLAPVQEDMDRKLAEKNLAQKTLGVKQASADLAGKAVADWTAALGNAEKEYSARLEEAAGKCSLCSLDPADPDIVAEIRTRFEAAKEAVKKADAALEKITAAEAEASRLQELADTAQKGISELDARIKGASDMISGMEGELKRLAAISESCGKNEAKSLSRVGTMITIAGWKGQFDAAPENFMESLKEKSSSYIADRDRCSAMQGEMEKKSGLLRSIESLSAMTLSVCPDWKPVYAQDAGRMSVPDSGSVLRDDPEGWRLQSRWSALLADVQALGQQVLAAERELADVVQALAGAASGPEGEIYGDRQSVEAAVARYGESADALNREIGAGMQRLSQDSENSSLAAQEKEKEGAMKAEYLRWSSLSDVFGDLNGVKFKKIAQGFVLNELLAGANRYLVHLSDRYRLDCQPGSLSITVHDLYQGGTERSVSTLSGGETFLVSLSLALGLSSLDGRGMNVGTLFIDEGFGTLSDDYLNVVMNTLENLHQTGGRKVGIISHVESLQERIPTQIRVRRQGNSASSVEVVSV